LLGELALEELRCGAGGAERGELTADLGTADVEAAELGAREHGDEAQPLRAWFGRQAEERGQARLPRHGFDDGGGELCEGHERQLP